MIFETVRLNGCVQSRRSVFCWVLIVRIRLVVVLLEAGLSLMIGCVLGRSASLGLIFLESAKDTVQRHQDLLNIHKLSLCRCRIGDWAEGRGYVSYGAGSRLYCKHTHTHTEIHTTAEHIVHTGLSVTSNAIQENLKINDISWRVTVSGESEVK